MKKILIATANKGKFAEFLGILGDLPFKFLSLEEFNLAPIKETGKTYRENAILKAKTYGQITGLSTLADDSGLEVEALGGRPGVESHRWHSGSDEERYRKLLLFMENVPDEKRAAEFVSVIAFFDPAAQTVYTIKGTCKGKIAFGPKGSYGFGFDPVFIVDGRGKHFAQLTPIEKNQISHRSKALSGMKKYLKKL